MRIKDLFTVPDGQKVTEKVFGRVLISSLCSILLCMTCLVSATWAWYTVSLQNPSNEINIGFPTVSVKVNDQELTGGKELDPGTYAVSITHAGDEDAFQSKSILYVTLTLDGTSKVCQLNAENSYQQSFTLVISAGKTCSFSWEATWFVPGGLTESVDGGTITIEELVPEQPSGDTTSAGGNVNPGETTVSVENATSGETSAPAENVTTGETTTPAEVTTGETTAPVEETTTAATDAPEEETTTAATDAPEEETTTAATDAPEEETTTDETTAPAEETP